MFYQAIVPPSFATRPSLLKKLTAALFLVGVVCGSNTVSFAQGFEKELNTPEKVEVVIKNSMGRVAVFASEEQQKRVSIRAESPDASVSEKSMRTKTEEGRVEIEVIAPDGSEGRAAKIRRANSDDRGDKNDANRIDLFVRVPLRARVQIRTESGAVDVVGNLEHAEVSTSTGTIRADVPLDALKYNFQWTASRPRFFSEVELPKVKEKRGGTYEVAGRFGDEKAKESERTKLDFKTERGVVLFGVSDPSMVPSDLRERPLTEAVRAIIKSGDEDLTEAVRKVAPRLVGDYTKTLPPLKGNNPTFATRRSSGSNPNLSATRIKENLARITASVTDRYGRAINGLTEKDFSVIENGAERPIQSVAPTTAPFNIVLLLDVSGSVEERLDFIRKAALSFINTISERDRIAIISFRDDVQIISDFTTDKGQLIQSVKKIEAGGPTALYDALAYTLVHTLKPLHGERTAIVILSDGDDNKSFIPFPEVLEATMETGALIYPLYIPSGLIQSNSIPAPERTLDPTRARFLTVTTRAAEEGRKLASVSGGIYYPITQLEQLQRAYDDVVSQLRTAYTITYASNAASKGDAPRVRIVLRNAEGASVRLSPAVNVNASP